MLPGLLGQLQRHLRQCSKPCAAAAAAAPPPAIGELTTCLRRLPHSPPVVSLGSAVAGALSAAAAAGFPDGATRVLSQIVKLLPAGPIWPAVRAPINLIMLL